MGDEGEANSGPATFAETIAQNLSSSTRRQYASRFAHFLEHLRRERDLAPDEIDLIDLDDVTLDDYQLFFERIQVKRTSGPFSAPVDPLKYNDTQTVAAYKAALVFSMRERNKPIPDATQRELTRFVGGYKRKVADLKEKGEMRLGEGKSPIPFSAYRLLARKALAVSTDIQQGIFSHSYLLLCWNLMARSNSVAKICLQHIGWEEVRCLVHASAHVNVHT